MYEKGTSAEPMQLLILSHLQPGVNVFSSSQCYSQAKEKYEHTTAMQVKVARVEDHADFRRLEQDFNALSVGYEIEVTTVFSHLQSGINVSSSLQCYGQTQAMERYEYTTTMMFKVARVEITAHTKFTRLKQTFIDQSFVKEEMIAAGVLLDNDYQALYLIVPGT